MTERNSSGVPAAAAAVWRIIRETDRFVRLHFVYFSGLLPLVGASTARRELSPAVVAALLGVGLSFHVYAYVLNDVMDLPVDRAQPLRQGDPLVRGAIAPWQALLVALAGIPAAATITFALGAPAAAYYWLGAAFALMAVYNAYGKRCPVPPLTDIVQGIAWGAVGVYGAYAVGAPGRLTWIFFAYAAGFILLINGIHGGLRDLQNDGAQGARTTAMFLGARTRPDGTTHVPAAIWIFSFTVNAALVALVIGALLANDFAYLSGTWTATLLVAGSVGVLSLVLLRATLRPDGAHWNMAFRSQLFCVVLLPGILFAPYLTPLVRGAVGFCLMLAMIPMSYTYHTAVWLWRRASSPFGLASRIDA